MSHTLSIRIPLEDFEWLEAESQRRRASKGAVVKELLTAARQDKRWARLGKYYGDLHGLPKDLSTRKAFAKGPK